MYLAKDSKVVFYLFRLSFKVQLYSKMSFMFLSSTVFKRFVYLLKFNCIQKEQLVQKRTMKEGGHLF